VVRQSVRIPWGYRGTNGPPGRVCSRCLAAQATRGSASRRDPVGPVGRRFVSSSEPRPCRGARCVQGRRRRLLRAAHNRGLPFRAPGLRHPCRISAGSDRKVGADAGIGGRGPPNSLRPPARTGGLPRVPSDAVAGGAHAHAARPPGHPPDVRRTPRYPRTTSCGCRIPQAVARRRGRQR
jgi:hypothetical protein